MKKDFHHETTLPMSKKESRLMALADIAKALKEPENYDEPELEEIRVWRQELEHRLTEEQETGYE